LASEQPLEEIANIRFEPIFGTAYFGQESLVIFDEVIGWLGNRITDVVRALDVGCGKGAFACRLAKETSIQVLGIDAEAANIEASSARAASLNLEHLVAFERGNFDDLTISSLSEPFDLIYALDSLQCSSDLGTCCRRLLRLLRPHGTFLATIWCFERPVAKVAAAWGFARHYDHSAVVQAISGLGLADVTVSVNANFARRCIGSLHAWEKHEATLESRIGRTAYRERLDLEKQTALAAQVGHLRHVIIRASVL
jgi:SAM-dependent methyltransferase